MEPPLLIRRMTLQDLERVIQIDRDSFTLPWPESSFRFEIEKNDASRCWVAEADHKIAAMIVTWLIVDEVHIATVAVDPACRRQGVAQRLLAHALLDACNSGARKAYLEVRQSNLAAQKLYEKFGFTAVGVRRRYYQDNHEDAVMMNQENLELRLLESLV